MRDKIDEIIELGLNQQLVDIDKVNDFIEKNRTNTQKLEKLLRFKLFEKRFYDTIKNKQLSNFDSNLIVNTSDDNIGVACLNSVWRSWKGKEDELMLGVNQISNSSSFIKKCNYKIAFESSSAGRIERI